MWPWKKSSKKVSSRQQIQIKEVRDGILVLPGNKHCLIIEASAINFELKSEDEQDVIIDSFQNFLNALPHAIQVLIRVREVDIDRYLETFSSLKEKEAEKVYKEQITSYCRFITNLVSGNKILSRRFYLVIPYVHKEGKHDFALIKEQLLLSKDIITRNLEKLGMKANVLSSLEILDLFYSFYNPREAKLQPLTPKTLPTLFERTYA
jgi:hypothetical protein